MGPPIAVGLALAALWVAATYALLAWRARAKRRRLREFLRDRRAQLEEAGARFLNDDCFEWDGCVFRLTGNANPLLRGNLSLRLSLFTPHVYEFSVKRARHVAPASDRLGADDLYRHCAVEGEVRPELEEYLLAPPIRDALTQILAERWDAVSRRHVEIVLFGNRFDYRGWDVAAMRRDLETLRALDAVPLERPPGGPVTTTRFGFEPNPWPWHWKGEHVLLLPPEVTRFCVSCWDGPLLNAVILDILFALADGDRVFLLTDDGEFPELACALRGGFAVRDHLFEFDTVRVAVAMDHVTEGRAVRGILAVPASFLPGARKAYAGAGRHDFHVLSIGLLGQLTFYARRLRDDEDSWWSGEYEILTTKRSKGQCERAAREAARRAGSDLREIERPFLSKLLKEDKLEMTA